MIAQNCLDDLQWQTTTAALAAGKLDVTNCSLGKAAEKAAAKS